MPATTRINLSNQERAVQAAVTRTVQSMSLAMKDGVLGALKSNVDRPAPFTLLHKAYQAAKPTVVGGVLRISAVLRNSSSCSMPTDLCIGSNILQRQDRAR